MQTLGLSSPRESSFVLPTPSSSPASSPSDSFRKRKRTASLLQDARLTSSNSSDELKAKSTVKNKQENKEVEAEEVEEAQEVLENIESQRAGSTSPRALTAKQFSHLTIVQPSRNQDTILESFIPTQKDDSPPAKRLPPPRGIRSPRPRHIASPVYPPLETQQTLSFPSISSPTPSREPARFPHSSPSSSAPSSMFDFNVDFDYDFDFDFTSLTWKDSEITGHLMVDSDDDGTGVNGIGFKPTASHALARKQRRRSQVLDWKSRTAREERERRAQRRRTVEASCMNTNQSTSTKKAVRFAL